MTSLGDSIRPGAFRKSSHSIGNGDCVEVGEGRAVIGVRDSKDPAGAVLAFRPTAWAAFTASLKGT